MNPLSAQRRRLFFIILAASLATALPSVTAFAQSSSSQQSSSGSQPSSSQQSSGQTQAPSQTQSGASIDPPAQKQESLGDAARKAKANKTSAAKPKVYTEDDISGMKGPGVSVVGSSPKKRSSYATPSDGDDGGPNSEEYWRSQARQILDAIAATDEAIEQKKAEIKKYGSGGFDVQTGRQDNIAYIHDREGQLKQLEKRKADLQKQLDDLADEGRKAGASPAWFR